MEKEKDPAAVARGKKGGPIGGKIVGNMLKARYGSEYFAKIGRKGGKQTKKNNPTHHRDIGKKGGDRTAELIRKGMEVAAQEENETINRQD